MQSWLYYTRLEQFKYNSLYILYILQLQRAKTPEKNQIDGRKGGQFQWKSKENHILMKNVSKEKDKQNHLNCININIGLPNERYKT